MELFKQEEVEKIKKVFPLLATLSTPDQFEDDFDIYGTYDFYKISVVEGGFKESGTSQMEILNINICLAETFKNIKNTVNLNFYEKLSDWNDNLDKFYKMLPRESEVLPFISDYDIGEDNEELPLFNVYKTNGGNDYAEIIENSLRNKYVDPLEDDWGHDEETIDQDASGFTDLMIQCKCRLSLLLPKLQSVLIEEGNKTINVFINKEINKSMSVDRIFQKIANKSGLYLTKNDFKMNNA